MNASQFRTGFDNFVKMLGASHPEWWPVWGDDFHEERARWFRQFVVSTYGCLNSPAEFIELRLGRSMGSTADIAITVFDADLVVTSVGQFGTDPEKRGGSAQFKVFPRSAIVALSDVLVDAARDEDADFPGRAKAIVDYGTHGALPLGHYDAKAPREIEAQFARFLPSLLRDLANVRR